MAAARFTNSRGKCLLMCLRNSGTKVCIAAGALLMSTRALAAQGAPDVAFVRAMIMHHSQAVEMAAMVPKRTADRSMSVLAERIDLSQRDEILRMQMWLKARGDSGAVASHEHMHTGADRPMPGMLTAVQLDSLRSLHGAAFERRFLTYMIQHHEGALAMVAKLLATPGGIRDPMLFQLANSIDADQRAEIARMRSMLTSRQRKQ